tara:strand:+ start:1273 stop:1485 length:213 start_codon:yes stop_codon:yes gene_type:complete
MRADLRINNEDLKALYLQAKGAYGNMTFKAWSSECEKSYMSYFNNKDLFNYKEYTYSQFVNAQTIALQVL